MSCANASGSGWPLAQYAAPMLADHMTAETQAPRTEPMTLAQMGVRLQDYLRRELGRAALELSPIRSIAEGHSGFTYRCTAAEGDWRQGRIMAALSAAGVPTPPDSGELRRFLCPRRKAVLSYGCRKRNARREGR